MASPKHDVWSTLGHAILSYVAQPSTLGEAAGVCKSFKELAQQPLLWQLVERTYYATQFSEGELLAGTTHDSPKDGQSRDACRSTAASRAQWPAGVKGRRTLISLPTCCFDFAFTRDLLLAAGESGTLTVVNRVSGAVLLDAPVSTMTVLSVWACQRDGTGDAAGLGQSGTNVRVLLGGVDKCLRVVDVSVPSETLRRSLEADDVETAGAVTATEQAAIQLDGAVRRVQADLKRYVAATATGQVHVLDAATLEQTQSFQAHEHSVTGCCLLLEARLCTLSVEGRALKVWSLAARGGKNAHAVPLHTLDFSGSSPPSCMDMGWHKGTGFVSVGLSDGSICVCDTNRGTVMRRLEGAHRGEVWDVAMSGCSVLSTGKDGRLAAHDLATGKVLFEAAAKWAIKLWFDYSAACVLEFDGTVSLLRLAVAQIGAGGAGDDSG